jgi:hypothetical protein
MRRDIALLLQSGQDATARIRVIFTNTLLAITLFLFYMYNLKFNDKLLILGLFYLTI